MKIVKKNQLKIVIFTAVKNRCILHGRVFVMWCMSMYVQLIKHPFFQVVFGGGRKHLLPNTSKDPESGYGERQDGRDLIEVNQ